MSTPASTQRRKDAKTQTRVRLTREEVVELVRVMDHACRLGKGGETMLAKFRLALERPFERLTLTVRGPDSFKVFAARLSDLCASASLRPCVKTP